jgi:hypothetical protein
MIETRTDKLTIKADLPKVEISDGDTIINEDEDGSVVINSISVNVRTTSIIANTEKFIAYDSTGNEIDVIDATGNKTT